MATPSTVSWSASDLKGPLLLEAITTVVPNALGGIKPIVATVLTLGLYVKGIASQDWLQMAQQIGQHHPSRIVVINPADPAGEPRLDASISATLTQRRPSDIPTLFSECVELNLKGGLATHWIDLIQPLIRPGVPAYLWWMGLPPLTGFRWDLLSTTGFTHLVIDTGTRDWRVWLPVLRDAVTHQMRVDDLHWQRLADLRQHWAQLADHTAGIRAIATVQAIEITWNTESPTPWVWWLAWIASRLGWTLVLNESEIPVAIATDHGTVPVTMRQGQDATAHVMADGIQIRTTMTDDRLVSHILEHDHQVYHLDDHRTTSNVQEAMLQVLNRGHDVLFQEALTSLLSVTESLGGALDA